MTYVYRHIRLDKNEPFYIGIGTDNNYKRAYSKNSRNIFWERVVKKTNYDVEIIMDNLTKDKAKQINDQNFNFFLCKRISQDFVSLQK